MPVRLRTALLCLLSLSGGWSDYHQRTLFSLPSSSAAAAGGGGGARGGSIAMMATFMLGSWIPCGFLPVAVAAEAGAGNDDMPSEEEMIGIDTVVRETDIVRMMKEQAEGHERDLEALRKTVTDELSRLHTHFEGIVSQMEQKETLLKNHIDALEEKLSTRLAKVKYSTTGDGEAMDPVSSGYDGGDSPRDSNLPPAPISHFWPFLFLFLLICCCGAFGFKEIRKLHLENDYWGSMRRASSGSGSFDIGRRKRSF